MESLQTQLRLTNSHVRDVHAVVVLHNHRGVLKIPNVKARIDSADDLPKVTNQYCATSVQGLHHQHSALRNIDCVDWTSHDPIAHSTIAGDITQLQREEVRYCQLRHNSIEEWHNRGGLRL